MKPCGELYLIKHIKQEYHLMRISRINKSDFDNALRDFPKTEIWRLQTDGWQHVWGPKNFRDIYYQGMNAAFDYIKQHLNKPINPEMIIGLHEAASQFENFFKEIKENGWDTIGDSQFSIFLLEPDFQNYPLSSLSKEGVPEFASALEKAYTAGLWKLNIDVPRSKAPPEGMPFYVDPKQKDLQAFLFKYLTMAGEDSERKLKNPNIKDDTICKLSCVGEKENIVKFMIEEIKQFHNEIKQAKKYNDNNKEDKIIEAIVKLTRNFHQTHIFKDGNGRTFIHLMLNMLLLQNNLSFCMVNTPSHFAGFSTEQLKQEVREGIKKFQEYKITQAKATINNLSEKDIDDIEKIKKELNSKLSQNPLIALSQINELFLRVKRNEIKVPHNYSGDTKSHLFLGSSSPSRHIAHNKILDLLKLLYLEKISNVMENYSNKPSEGFEVKSQQITYTDKQVFQHMIEQHRILSEKLPNNKFLKDEVDSKINEYFEKSIASAPSFLKTY